MKDPLQPDQTPYEVLGVGMQATDQEIDQAFRAGLAKRSNVAKLTAARRTLQQPIDRALVDAFLYQDPLLSRLDPNPLHDPSVLLSPRRDETATSWTRTLRQTFPDLPIVHSLGVLYYWSALALENPEIPRTGKTRLSTREIWQRTIACWSMLIVNDEFWDAVPSAGRAELQARLADALRSTLQDLEQPHRERAATAEAEVYQELELALALELDTARAMLACRGYVAHACGPLMLREVGALDAVRQQVRSARAASAAARVAGAPGRAEEAAYARLEAMLSPHADVRALLDRQSPQAALEALDRLDAEARSSQEARTLRCLALFQLGRQKASLDQVDAAIDTWEAALQCDDPSVEPDILTELAVFCQTRAAALQNTQGDVAVLVLERGMDIIRDRLGYVGEPTEANRLHSVLRLTLAEILAPRAIAAINATNSAAADGKFSDEALTTMQRHVDDLERAAELGSPLALAQVPKARALLAGARWGARTERTVEFAALPAPVREHFVSSVNSGVAPVPLADKKRGGVSRAFFAVLGAGVLLALAVADIGRSTVYQPASMLPVYFAAAFGTVWSALLAYRTKQLRRALGYAPGTYLFPMEIVDARDLTLRIMPLSELTNFQAVHNHTNGRYQHTSLTFTFGKRVESFTINDQPRADRAIAQLGASRQAVNRALDEGDLETLAAHDPFDPRDGATAGAPAHDSLAQVPKAPEFKRWSLMVAAAAAVAIALPLWLVRNVVSDQVSYSQTRAANTEAAYETYVANGWRHVTEAKAALPKIAFDEARRAGTVGALRTVLRKYPDSAIVPDARREISAVYAKAFEQFRAQASTYDPRMLPFMERLFRYLAAHDTAVLTVRFRPPNVDALRAHDRRILARGTPGGQEILPAAPHFQESDAATRETAMVRELNNAFKAILPADVLEITEGGRLPAAPAPLPKASEAEMLVEYDIVPSGAEYQPVRNGVRVAGPSYTGILANFFVRLQIPKDEVPLDLRFRVEPPPQFSVGQSSAPGDIYRIMLMRALDDLTARVREVFFGKSAQKPGRGGARQ